MSATTAISVEATIHRQARRSASLGDGLAPIRLHESDTADEPEDREAAAGTEAATSSDRYKPEGPPRHAESATTFAGRLSQPCRIDANLQGPGHADARNETHWPVSSIASTLTPSPNGTSTNLRLPRRNPAAPDPGGLSATSPPAPASRLDIRPVGLAPSFECGEGFLEGTTEIGQLIEGSGVDPAGIEMAHD